jgi:hypothetical protein
MKKIAYLERTRAEYPAKWSATTDTGEILAIDQGAEITVTDADGKVIFSGKSPKPFGLLLHTLQEETASVLEWPIHRPALPPQNPETCSSCRGTDKVAEVFFKVPGRVNQYYGEKSRLCDPCRKGPYKARFKKTK